MASSLRLVLTLLTLVAVNLVSAEIRPNPIPRVYPDENLVDNTLYGLAFGSNNKIQQRIVALENSISKLVNQGEVIINKYLDKVEADIIKKAATNGVANVEATITFIDGQISTFETNIYALVKLLIKKVRADVEKLKTQIETETQASLAAFVVRSAITRIERLIEQTISSLKQVLNRTKLWVEAIIHAAEQRARGLTTDAQTVQLVQQAKLAVDRSFLVAENEANAQIWQAYNRVRSESKPLNALLHSLL